MPQIAMPVLTVRIAEMHYVGGVLHTQVIFQAPDGSVVAERPFANLQADELIAGMLTPFVQQLEGELVRKMETLLGLQPGDGRPVVQDFGGTPRGLVEGV